MDGPISTSENAGSFQQAAPVTFRSPSVGPPEKVPPVTEGERSRSPGRDETGSSEKTDRSPLADRERSTGNERTTTKRDPAFCVEFGPGKADSANGRGRREPSGDLPPPPLDKKAREAKQKEEALADVKERWAEVNQEALESGVLPGQGEPVWAEGTKGTEESPTRTLSESEDEAADARGKDIADTGRASTPAEVGFASREQDPTTPSTGAFQGSEEAENGLQRQLTSRYEAVATSLANPHPTQPIVDLFV